MELSLKQRLLLVVVLQTLVLVAMIANKQWTLNTGTLIVLETRPIDPRSLFRGDYVRLRYAISDLDLGALKGDRDFRRFDPVYVTLIQSGRYWIPVSVRHRRTQDIPAAQVVVRGEVEYVNGQRWLGRRDDVVGASQIHVRYGIENYFVSEGAGRALERPGNGKEVSIQVAVDNLGRAGIKAVLINGKPRFVESLF